MNWVLVVIYFVDFDVVGLFDFGLFGNYYCCQIDCWIKQYWVSEIGIILVMDELIVWLDVYVLEDDG